MNPARSIAPAVFDIPGALAVVWVYVAGPVLGGALATLVTWMLRGRPPARARENATGELLRGGKG